MEHTLIKVGESDLDNNLSITVLNKEFKCLRGEVVKELEKDEYNSIVTFDNMGAMKKTATALNKTATQISDFRIAKKKDEMKDIDKFEDNLKDITQLFLDKRESILDGVKIFEDEAKKKIVKACNEYLNVFYDEVGLREEFRDIDVSDMTKKEYATGTFKISAKGKNEIESRVNVKLTLQTKVDNRILSLENECYKANIEPLTVQHIQGFLYADDETYNAQLKKLIDSEILRAEQIKKKADIEAKQKAEQEQKEKVNSQVNQVNSIFQQPWGMLSLDDLKEQLVFISSYDEFQYDLCADHAKTQKDNAIDRIKKAIYGKYQVIIQNAELSDLVAINIEINQLGIDDNSKDNLKKLCFDRQEKLEDKQNDIDTSMQDNHMASIVNEKPNDNLFDKKDIIDTKPKKETSNGKVKKYVTVSFAIEVPNNWSSDQVQDVYKKRFDENIKNALDLAVEVK